MEYTYELLRKCDGLRFRAEFYASPKEGVIKVAEDCVYLCYGNDVLRPEFNYMKTLKVLEGQPLNCGRISHFEIVPRDPETYQDWQVGDKVTERPGETQTVIFRSGELMVTKRFNGEASCPFTCGEFFEKGYRLVLTDIEKQIIEEKNPKWKPQDGDILTNEEALVIYAGTKDDGGIISYVGVDIEDSSSMTTEIGPGWGFSRDYRPATYEEKQLLFEVLAKNGKRWNAEKKVVEDIEPEADEPENNNEPDDVQKMISNALTGYTPKGDIEGFPIEVIAKMLERQYEQNGKIDISVFEKNRADGFEWHRTIEGVGFWASVIIHRSFSIFFEKYPKTEHTFKKYDTVLTRNEDDDIWYPTIFSRYGEDKYYVLSIIGDFAYNQCIPLNKDTEKLIGTTDKYDWQ